MDIDTEVIRDGLAASYGLDVEDIRLIGISENHGYRVRCVDGTEYFVRVHAYAERDPTTLPAEADFLDQLYQLAPFVAPTVIRTRDGRSHAEIGGKRNLLLMLFSWLPGEHRSYRDLGPEDTGAMAEATGYFHLASQRIRQTYQRPTYDFTFYCGPDSFYHRADLRDLVAKEDMDPFVELKTRFGEYAVSRGEEDMGMIHYDLHLGNFLFDAGEARIIDFDECGYGYYLFDLGHILFAMRESPDHAELERVFIERYERITGRHVPRRDLELFKGVQAVAIMHYFFRLLDRAGGRKNLMHLVPGVAQTLRDILESLPSA